MLIVTGEADRFMATVERQAHAFMPWQMVLRSLLIPITILIVTRYCGSRDLMSGLEGETLFLTTVRISQRASL